MADFPAQGRNGQGVVVAKPTPKLGNLAGAALVAAGDSLLCLTAGGGTKLIPAASIPEMGRPAQGKPVIPLVGGDQVTRVSAVSVKENGGGEAAGEAKTKAKAEVKAEKSTHRKRIPPT